MNAPTPSGGTPRSRARRPVVALIAVLIGLGGLGTATGMTLGAVGAASAPDAGPGRLHHGPPGPGDHRRWR
ncbi:MAG TPA: hypothetical protein VNA11_10725 [Pseudonocardia sp.]|nr:hypothetical protein [Pseudonocardia sp.]